MQIIINYSALCINTQCLFYIYAVVFLTMKMLFLSHNNQETQVKEGVHVSGNIKQGKIGNITLKNRLVMSPMVQGWRDGWSSSRDDCIL